MELGFDFDYSASLSEREIGFSIEIAQRRKGISPGETAPVSNLDESEAAQLDAALADAISRKSEEFGK